MVESIIVTTAIIVGVLLLSYSLRSSQQRTDSKVGIFRRTRLVRTLINVGPLVGMYSVLMPYVRGNYAKEDWWAAVALVMMPAAGSVFLHAVVILDDRGVTKRRFWSSKTLEWSDIQEVAQDIDTGYIELKGSKTKIAFDQLFEGRDEFLEQINLRTGLEVDRRHMPVF